MHRHSIGARAVAVLALWLFACGGTTQRGPLTPDDVQAQQTASRSSGDRPFRDLVVNADAQALPSSCGNASYEQCNGLDDDCNGVIDDECGYEGGDVQITVSWDTGADIDLYVTDPSSATLYYNEQHKRSKIGGHLDHDARGNCRREQANPRIENAYWPAPAKPGEYRVELHYFSPCAQAAATTATLSVEVGGELLGSYRYHLEPEQRIEALRFVKR